MNGSRVELLVLEFSLYLEILLMSQLCMHANVEQFVLRMVIAVNWSS